VNIQIFALLDRPIAGGFWKSNQRWSVSKHCATASRHSGIEPQGLKPKNGF